MMDSASSEDPFSFSERPNFPTMMVHYKSLWYSLHCHKIEVKCEFNVSTAFVKLTGTWFNELSTPADLVFALPTKGTVTSVNVEIQERQYKTMVIPTDLAEEIASDQPKPKKEPEGTPTPDGQLPPDMSFNDFIPDLFRLPIRNVAPDEQVNVSVVWIEPLIFSGGMYSFSLPMNLGNQLLPNGKTYDEVISFSAVINSVQSKCNYVSKSHDVELIEESDSRVSVKLKNFAKTVTDETGEEKIVSTAIHFGYSLVSSDILPTLINEPKDDGGSFLLFVTPPSQETFKNNFFSRNMVFLLDRSGSMSGIPYTEAVRALTVALSRLSPNDNFNICAFDHNQEYFSQHLLKASVENISSAKTWLATVQPDRGLTDINTPMEWALDVLENGSDGLVLPFLVLLTDGCVATERNLCRKAHSMCKRTRILTFGIGKYSNWFFLKMLSNIGRGFSDVVVYSECIYEQIVQLIEMAAVPVLTNVQVEVQGVTDLEIYPFPVPDLFMGAPLTISGSYKGTMPSVVTITAQHGDGRPYVENIEVRRSDVIPVEKVFVKQRLDLLTARAWLEESDEYKEEVVALSCENSIPSAHTMMVAYENTDAKSDNPRDTDRLLDADDDEKTDDFNFKNKNMPKGKKWYRNKKNIAAMCVGGAVLVGAAAFSFGDVAASAGNIPIMDGLGGGGECCECDGCDGGCDDCGDCDCDCGDCLAC